MSKVPIAGEEIEYDVTASGAAQQKAVILFAKKDKREKLAEDKRQDLFEKITKPKLTKFDLVSLTLSDEDKLDDTYNLGVLVTKMRNHLERYDCADVFNVLELDPTNKKKPTGVTTDLFTEYSALMEDQVAESNEWYRVYPKQNYYRDNLQLTLEFLENNCTEQLWEKVLEMHDEYPSEKRGGPLAFLIMMKLLSNFTESWDTVMSKRKFERLAYEEGVEIKGYMLTTYLLTLKSFEEILRARNRSWNYQEPEPTIKKELQKKLFEW
jgi:hypothetical protein